MEQKQQFYFLNLFVKFVYVIFRLIKYFRFICKMSKSPDNKPKLLMIQERDQEKSSHNGRTTESPGLLLNQDGTKYSNSDLHNELIGKTIVRRFEKSEHTGLTPDSSLPKSIHLNHNSRLKQRSKDSNAHSQASMRENTKHSYNIDIKHRNSKDMKKNELKANLEIKSKKSSLSPSTRHTNQQVFHDKIKKGKLGSNTQNQAFDTEFIVRNSMALPNVKTRLFSQQREQRPGRMPAIDKQGVLSPLSSKEQSVNHDLDQMNPIGKTSSVKMQNGDHVYLRDKDKPSRYRDISKILEPISKGSKRKREFVLKGEQQKTFQAMGTSVSRELLDEIHKMNQFENKIAWDTSIQYAQTARKGQLQSLQSSDHSANRDLIKRKSPPQTTQNRRRKQFVDMKEQNLANQYSNMPKSQSSQRPKLMFAQNRQKGQQKLEAILSSRGSNMQMKQLLNKDQGDQNNADLINDPVSTNAKSLNDNVFTLNMLKQFPSSDMSKQVFRQMKLNQINQFSPKNGQKSTNNDNVSVLIETSQSQGDHNNNLLSDRAHLKHSLLFDQNGDMKNPFEQRSEAKPNTLAKRIMQRRGARNTVSIDEGANRKDDNVRIDVTNVDSFQSVDSLDHDDGLEDALNQEDSCQDSIILINKIIEKTTQRDETLALEESLMSSRNPKELQQSKYTHTQSYAGRTKQLQLKQLLAEIDDKSMTFQERLKAVDFVKKTNKEAMTFFKERDDEMRHIIEKVFQNGLINQQAQELFHSVIDSIQFNQTHLLKYVLKQKQLQEFQTKQQANEKELLQKELDKYRQKELDLEKYRQQVLKKDNSMDQLIGEYQKIPGLLEQKVSKADLHDEFSGVTPHLENALKSMKEANSLKLPESDDTGLDHLPFDTIQELLDEKTSNIQKRTAFKVLQTYFRNVKQADFESQVNFDFDLSQKMISLENQHRRLQQDLAKHVDYINKLKAENMRLNGEIKQMIADAPKKDRQIREAQSNLEIAEGKILELKLTIKGLENQRTEQNEKLDENHALVNKLKAENKRLKKELKEIDDLKDLIQKLKDEKNQMAADYEEEKSAMKRLLDNLQKKLKELEEKLAEQLHLCKTKHEIKNSQASIKTVQSKKPEKKVTARPVSELEDDVQDLPRAELQKKLTKKMSQYNDNHDKIKDLISENQKLKVQMDLLRRLQKQKRTEQNANETNEEILEDHDSDIDIYMKEAEKPRVPMKDQAIQTETKIKIKTKAAAIQDDESRSVQSEIKEEEVKILPPIMVAVKTQTERERIVLDEDLYHEVEAQTDITGPIMSVMGQFKNATTVNMNNQNTHLGVSVGIVRKMDAQITNIYNSAKKKESNMNVTADQSQPSTRLHENQPEQIVQKMQVKKKPTTSLQKVDEGSPKQLEEAILEEPEQVEHVLSPGTSSLQQYQVQNQQDLQQQTLNNFTSVPIQLEPKYQETKEKKQAAIYSFAYNKGDIDVNQMLQKSVSPYSNKEDSLHRISKDKDTPQVNNSKGDIKKGKLRRGRTRVYHTNQNSEEQMQSIQIGLQAGELEKRNSTSRDQERKPKRMPIRKGQSAIFEGQKLSQRQFNKDGTKSPPKRRDSMGFYSLLSNSPDLPSIAKRETISKNRELTKKSMSMALSLQEKVTVTPQEYYSNNKNMNQTVPKKQRMNIDIIQENDNESGEIMSDKNLVSPAIPNISNANSLNSLIQPADNSVLRTALYNKAETLQLGNGILNSSSVSKLPKTMTENVLMKQRTPAQQKSDLEDKQRDTLTRIFESEQQVEKCDKKN